MPLKDVKIKNLFLLVIMVIALAVLGLFVKKTKGNLNPINKADASCWDNTAVEGCGSCEHCTDAECSGIEGSIEGCTEGGGCAGCCDTAG